MRTRLAALLRRWADRLNPPPDLRAPTSFRDVHFASSLASNPGPTSINGSSGATITWTISPDNPAR